GNTDPYSQSRSRAVTKLCNSRDQCQPGAHRALGIVLVRLRIAEIGEYAIARVSSDEPTRPGDLLGTAAVVGANDFPQVLSIEPCRERCRVDKIGEHNRDLASLCLRQPSRRSSRFGLIELRNRAQ